MPSRVWLICLHYITWLILSHYARPSHPPVFFVFFLSVSHNGPVLDHLRVYTVHDQKLDIMERLRNVQFMVAFSVYFKESKNEWLVDCCTGYTIKIDIIDAREH